MEKEIYRQVGRSILAMRQRRKIKQHQMARDLKIDVTVLSRIENGERPIKLCQLSKFADYLACPVADLVDFPVEKIFSGSVKE